MVRKHRDVSFSTTRANTRPRPGRTRPGKSRVSILETLSRVVPVVTRDLPGAPDPDVLRLALRKEPQPGRAARASSTTTERQGAGLAGAGRRAR